jgi:hypothetical protein
MKRFLIGMSKGFLLSIGIIGVGGLFFGVFTGLYELAKKLHLNSLEVYIAFSVVIYSLIYGLAEYFTGDKK